MADRECLERLKKLAENNYFVGCPGDGTEFQFTAEVDWLIEQAERAERMQDVLDQDHRQAVLEGLYEENLELKERVQELEQALQGLRDVNLGMSSRLDNYLDLSFKLEGQSVNLNEQNKRYREALEFYADSKKYHVETSYDVENEICGFGNIGKVIVDHGKIAREALEESLNGDR